MGRSGKNNSFSSPLRHPLPPSSAPCEREHCYSRAIWTKSWALKTLMSCNCFWCQNQGKQTFAWREGIKRSLCTAFQTGQCFLEVQLLFWKTPFPCPGQFEYLLKEWQWVNFPVDMDELNENLEVSVCCMCCEHDHGRHSLGELLFVQENLKIHPWLP